MKAVLDKLYDLKDTKKLILHTKLFDFARVWRELTGDW